MMQVSKTRSPRQAVKDDAAVRLPQRLWSLQRWTSHDETTNKGRYTRQYRSLKHQANRSERAILDDPESAGIFLRLRYRIMLLPKPHAVYKTGAPRYFSDC